MTFLFKYISVRMVTTADQLFPDIWQEVFEYFNAIELFNSFRNVTITASEVLSNKKYHLRLRRLVLDVSVRRLPEKLLLSHVVSLELHQENSLDIIHHCPELRSLTLVGPPEWIVRLLRRISFVNKKIEQLTLLASDVGSLQNVLDPIASLVSLRRLVIHANQWTERTRGSTSLPIETKIEQFILHSSSSSWNPLSSMLTGLSNIRFIDITLSHNDKNLISSICFSKLRYMRLTLLEVSFDSIAQAVTRTPSLSRLKLYGLINSHGFITSHKWLDLFQSCSSLVTVIVNISIEEETNLLRSEIIQAALNRINLNLRCIDETYDLFSNEPTQHRWWSLSGIISKQNELVQKEQQMFSS